MSDSLSYYERYRVRGLVVAGLIVAAIVAQFFIFATPHKNSNNLRTSAAAPCTVSAILVNSCRPWQGDSSNKYPGVTGGLKQRTTDFETRTGVQVDFAHDYTTGAYNLSADDLYYINRANTYLLINYKPSGTGNWSTMGGSDATVNSNIDTFAKSIKAVAPKKVMIAIWHEPQNDVSSGSTGCGASFKYVGNKGTPAQYKAMWQNVRQRFSNLGVTNAVFAIIYMGDPSYECMDNELYPGDNLVDWVIWDKYLSNSDSFQSGFNIFYNWLTANSTAAHNYVSHPWGIGEWGSWSSSQSTVYQQYIDGGKALKANSFPNIKLWTLWDSVGNGDSRILYNAASVLDATEQTTFINNWAKNPVFTSGGCTGDCTAPTVSITTPANGATINATINVAVTANDNVGVTRVKIVEDGSTVVSDKSSGTGGWGGNWDTTVVTNGSHSLLATAYDAAGNIGTSSTVGVTVSNQGPPQNPVINSFTANPTTVIVGQASTFSWSTTNTVNCSLNPGGPQNSTATTWTSLAYTTAGSTTYTLTCKNSAGTTVSKAATVTVNPAPTPPTNVQLSADKTTIQSGASVFLSWSSNGSTSCTLNPGGFTASGGSSGDTITNLTKTTIYIVTCTNSAGSTDSSPVTVTVTPTPPPPADPVINSFVANPGDIAYAATSTLSWQTSNVVGSGCSVAPSPLSSTDGNGTWTTPSLTASASYTLSCHNSVGTTVSKSTSVTVAGQPPPPPPPPTNGGTTSGNGTSSTVHSTTGQTVADTQNNSSVTDGSLLTLDSSNVTDNAKIKNIVKVEFYSGNTLIQTVNKAPFALDSSKAKLKPGTYNLTERTYYTDGSMSQQTQLVTLKAKNSAVVSNGARLFWLILVSTGVFALILLGIRWWFNGPGSGASPIDGNKLPTIILTPTAHA